MKIPCYPAWTPMDQDLVPELHTLLAPLTDGVSEYTAANLFLFRTRYQYQVSLSPNGALIITGEHGAAGGRKPFFLTPVAVPEPDILQDLFNAGRYWKGISDSLAQAARTSVPGLVLTDDRDNFDYLYHRSDLAALPGKKYHKKRNLISSFLRTYPCHDAPLTPAHVPAALAVLDQWRVEKGADGDYAAAREALEQHTALGLQGAVYLIKDRMVGWCLGEPLVQGRMFAVHFEKGLDAYKGLYQYINQRYAAALPAACVLINREQDLGDEGLRQAKLTYRPCGFVQKRIGRR